MPLVSLLLLELVEQNSSQHFFFFFTQCYSNRVLFFVMYKFVHRMIVLFDTIYIIFNTNLGVGCVKSVVGLFSLRVLKGGKFTVCL